MIIQLDPSSAVPIFEQVRQQFIRLISAGHLEPGSVLPPMRQLASDLDVARGTVAKVYDALARDGYVETNGRHGTIVLSRPAPAVTASDLALAADTVAVVALQLGTHRVEVHRAVDEALDRLDAGENDG